MRRKNLRLRRRFLAMQAAAVMGLGFATVSGADDYSDYFGSENGKVALTSGQLSDPCPCPPSGYQQGTMPYNEGNMQPIPDSGSIAGGSSMGSSISNAPNAIPQNQIDSFSPSSSPSTANSLAFASGGGGRLDAPNMVGDSTMGAMLSYVPGLFFPLAEEGTVAVAGGDRRFKIPENVSPIPLDRVFFTYNHFHNAVIDANANQTHIDRMLFGIEKTFLNGNASAEFRLPFAAALNGDQQLGGNNNEAVEFGNLGFALKVNLLSGADWIISSGALLTVPTGTDAQLLDGGNNIIFNVENDSYQLAPFLGFLKQYGRDWFIQGFAQVNFDLNGYEVSDGAGNVQYLQEQTLMFVDASLGRWLYRCDNACGLQRGIAAISELHYTTTLKDADSVGDANQGGTLTNASGRTDILNATGALHFQNGPTALRVGGVAPIRDDRDRMFDAEFFIQLNRYF